MPKSFGFLPALLLLAACGPDSPPATPASTTPSPVPTANATATPSGGDLELGSCGSYRQADNVLTNGDFEAPSINTSSQTFQAGESFTNWKVELGSVALLAGGFAKPSGNQALALGGTVSQQVSAFAGKSYQLTLCYSTTPSASAGGLEIKWEGQSAATVALDPPSNQPVFKGLKLRITAAGTRPTVSLNGSGVTVDAVRLELIP